MSEPNGDFELWCRNIAKLAKRVKLDSFTSASFKSSARVGGRGVGSADVHESCLMHVTSKALPSEPKFQSFDLEAWGKSSDVLCPALRNKRIDK